MVLVRRLRESPLLGLRHDSPVGHFFAVPDLTEVERAWDRTVEGLLAHHEEAPAAANPIGDLDHGLPQVFAAIAGQGQPLTAGTLLARIATRLASCLGVA
jgi:hypothetical protein